jgi:hypothetical protein
VLIGCLRWGKRLGNLPLVCKPVLGADKHGF